MARDSQPVKSFTHSRAPTWLRLKASRRKLVYRWHFDAVCYTAIVYLTDVRPQDGGSLRVIPKCCQHVAPDLRTAKFCDIWPSAGTIVLMDSTRCYHRVTQLLRPGVRLSIPRSSQTARHQLAQLASIRTSITVLLELALRHDVREYGEWKQS